MHKQADKKGEKSGLSIADYASALARTGTQVLPGTGGAFWVGYESGALMRLPTFHLEPPSLGEVRRVCWQGRVAVASYLLRPDKRHVANAWLYVCDDEAYALDKLSAAMRRNVRRGLKELNIGPITSDQLLTYGMRAFCETRRRVGLSDGIPAEFYRRFTLRTKCPGHVFRGAWKDEKLAAFLSITEVEDWAEIEGCFSVDALLHLRPNDALLFDALTCYLTERACRVVSYGLSSVQLESAETGLHAFKTKVGFRAQPVHRAFIFHPLLSPFANRLTLWGMRTVLQLRPGNRYLKKLVGVLACTLQKR